MIHERTINILKRISFDFFKIIDIDDTADSVIIITVENVITSQDYTVPFSYDMLKLWYEQNILEYAMLKEYILSNISQDYYTTKEDIDGWEKNT